MNNYAYIEKKVLYVEKKAERLLNLCFFFSLFIPFCNFPVPPLIPLKG